MASYIGHPFGRENEVSIHKLWQSFCNHLYLGQWEFARACINELYDQRALLGRDVLAVLKALASNPYTVQ